MSIRNWDNLFWKLLLSWRFNRMISKMLLRLHTWDVREKRSLSYIIYLSKKTNREVLWDRMLKWKRSTPSINVSHPSPILSLMFSHVSFSVIPPLSVSSIICSQQYASRILTLHPTTDRAFCICVCICSRVQLSQASGGMCVSACSCFYSCCVHLLAYLNMSKCVCVCVCESVWWLQCAPYLHTSPTINPAQSTLESSISPCISILITTHVNIVVPSKCENQNILFDKQK